MPGKTVVFCEGIHEATLVSLILEERGITSRIITHESLRDSRESTPENNRINEFLGRKGDSYKFLLKDEGGDKKCVSSFIELYKDRDESYSVIVFVDSPVYTYFKETAFDELKRDILKPESANLFLTRDSKSPRTIHRIFFTPISLEHQVQTITGENLYNHDRDKQKAILKQFISECKLQRIDWFLEFEEIVLS
ncbi:MAG: hypothetical protein WC379_09670 [Methanoregula sp.]|jgi:hypothetical protein